MTSAEIKTIGDLVNFLLQFDPNKHIKIYDDLFGEVDLVHIDVEDNRIVIFGE